jgi:hypothetical protein
MHVQKGREADHDGNTGFCSLEKRVEYVGPPMPDGRPMPSAACRFSTQKRVIGRLSAARVSQGIGEKFSYALQRKGQRKMATRFPMG